MKKILSIVLVFASININAQKTTEKSNEIKAVKKGNIMVDAYYGFPNLFKSLFGVIYRESNKNGDVADNYSIVGFGPVGGNVQYMLEDNIGLLLEGNYMDFGVNWQNKVSATSYNYGFKVKIIRAMVGGEYHFGANEKVDAFAGAKVGLNIANASFNSNDPDFNALNYSFRNYRTGIGFSSRLYAGIRFFPIKPLGIFFEGGLFGGGIVRGGVSIKL